MNASSENQKKIRQLLEKKKRTDLSGLLKAQREGTLNEYLAVRLPSFPLSIFNFLGCLCHLFYTTSHCKPRYFAASCLMAPTRTFPRLTWQRWESVARDPSQWRHLAQPPRLKHRQVTFPLAATKLSVFVVSPPGGRGGGVGRLKGYRKD
jgi:hypothetical protein